MTENILLNSNVFKIPLYHFHAYSHLAVSSKYYRDSHSTVFIVALVLISNNWKQPTCLPTDKWVLNIYYIYKMEYYLASKNRIMKFEGK